jgi:hypothetical protein
VKEWRIRATCAPASGTAATTSTTASDVLEQMQRRMTFYKVNPDRVADSETVSKADASSSPRRAET